MTKMYTIHKTENECRKQETENEIKLWMQMKKNVLNMNMLEENLNKS